MSTFHRIHSLFSMQVVHARNLSLALFCMMLAIMPMLYMGGQPWWLSLTLGLLMFATAVNAFRSWWLGGDTAKVPFHPEYLLFILPILWCLLQSIPLGPVLPLLAPQNAAIKADFNAIGIGQCNSAITLSADATIRQMYAWLLGLVCFHIVVTRVRTGNTLIWVMVCIMLAALGNAALMYMQLNTQAVPHPEGKLWGNFANRNHFAFHLNMGLYAALALYFCCRPSPQPKTSRPDINWQKRRIRWEIPLALIMLVICAAILICQSRGGFLSFAIGGILFGFLAYLLVNPHTTSGKLPIYKRPLLALTLVLVIISCFALYHAANRVFKRFESIEFTDLNYDRWPIWRETLRMAGNHWPTGIGAGAYISMSQQYSGDIQLLIPNAHNDYLELLAEYGIPFGIVWLALAFVCLFRRIRDVLGRHDKIPAWCGLGAVCTLIGNAVHEWTDYNIQAWANAMLYASLLGVAVVCSRHFPSDHSCHDDKERRQGRFTTRLPRLAASLLFVAMVVFFIRQCPPEWHLQQLLNDIKQPIPALLLGTEDDQRRLNLSLLAQQDTPFRTAAHSLRARALWEASMRHGIIRPKLLEQACDEICNVMRRTPCTPVDAMACARFHDDANRAGVRRSSPLKLFRLYDWAVRCQPNVRKTVVIAANAAFKHYAYSLMSNPAQADLLRPSILNMLRQALIANPDSVEICNLLLQMDLKREELANFLPNTTSSRLLLATSLKNRGNWRLALDICKGFSRSGIKPQDTSKDINYKIKAIVLEMEIHEILGDEKSRCECWSLLENYLAFITEEKAKKVADKDSALMVLRNLCWRSFTPPSVILEAARLEVSMGEADQVPFFLLNLLTNDYAKAGTLPTSVIRQAIALLPTKMTLDPPTHFRTQALANAFQVMLAENNPQSLKNNKIATNNLLAAAVALERLGDSSVTREGETLWGQSHLTYIFAARARLLLGDREQCISDCRKALLESRNNWYALQVLHAAAPEALTAAETHVYNVLASRKAPLCRLSNGLQLAAIESVPFEITRAAPEQDVTLYFLLEREIKFIVKGKFDYCTARNQHMFHANGVFPQSGTSMFSWRIGEIHTASTRNSLWASKDRLFPKGRFYLKLNLIGESRYELNVYPTPIFCIGDIK